jgi:hypothetical protein
MKILRWLPIALVAVFLPLLAHAATATIAWNAPTTATDSSPLTGAQAITSYQVWIATSSIASNTAAPPTATITGSATTTTQTVTASPGATIFARVKACNAAGCSDLSAEASKTLPLTVPNPPTNITVTIAIGP